MVATYLSVLSQVCRLFMHLRIVGECFLPVIIVIILVLYFYFSTYVIL